MEKRGEFWGGFDKGKVACGKVAFGPKVARVERGRVIRQTIGQGRRKRRETGEQSTEKERKREAQLFCQSH